MAPIYQKREPARLRPAESALASVHVVAVAVLPIDRKTSRYQESFA